MNISFSFIFLLSYYCYFPGVVAIIDVNEKDLKLELVQVLLRHGARTPDQTAINLCGFSLASLYEPLGLKQLTNEGKQQEYQFGKFLRARYSNYLSPFYKPEDVYAYATMLDRTQMSLQLVLAGLYPHRYPAVWDFQLNWSPIPYLTVPKKFNILLQSHQNSKFKKIKNQMLDSAEFAERFAKLSKFFNFIKARTMIEDNVTLSNIDSTFDVLTANEYSNLPLPYWYTPEIKGLFIEVDNIKRDAYVATPEMRRMGPGPLIKTFVENMNLNETFVNPRKIYLYGGQEANIAMFIRAHNISEFRYAPFGSALILEKLRDYKGQVYVRLLAWDGLGNLMTLKLGNHEEFCPIEDYLRIVESVVPSEQEINALLGNFTAEQVREILFEDGRVTLVSASI